MKDRILNIIITASMVIAANYPMYKSMVSTAEEAKIVVESVKEEILIWQNELDKMRSHLNSVRNDMIGSIDGGIKESKIAIDKIKSLELEIKLLGDKIDSLKIDTKDKVKKMINFNKIFDIRG